MNNQVKGIKKLNNAITKQLQPFGIEKARCDKDYSYIRGKNKITFKITESSIDDVWFLEFIEERFHFQPLNIFIFSILHELGHHYTDDFLSAEADEFCEAEKQRIDEEMKTADDIYSKTLEWQYFSLPDEILATQWAVNYCKENPQKVQQMWNNMQDALYNFYKINGIFEEIA